LHSAEFEYQGFDPMETFNAVKKLAIAHYGQEEAGIRMKTDMQKLLTLVMSRGQTRMMGTHRTKKDPKFKETGKQEFERLRALYKIQTGEGKPKEVITLGRIQATFAYLATHLLKLYPDVSNAGKEWRKRLNAGSLKGMLGETPLNVPPYIMFPGANSVIPGDDEDLILAYLQFQKFFVKLNHPGADQESQLSRIEYWAEITQAGILTNDQRIQLMEDLKS